ncbi:MAG TPA: cobyric acid synthase [Porphyromonadaceae bacterium]|jgi:adenosylcobyric acid synthase|nr:cobyric acid synthase [Porphyromonadaceae bacterium]HBK31231.1 cobyric acid synthase [Porphyromonadaceae bacterium]HBL33946.1 cobyric acid synthase [Porphyromonadaceae bacterium]HBX19751.1 cobyric acid synthase [Porphyromonadaceae bacterium]
MKKLRPIMFVGTGSDVGKSVINAGFCRVFLQDGYAPAPFKAQNMSLNSFATADNLEIGRAQAVQADACGIDCRIEMNPILLKPTGNQTSQVVLNGKPAGNKSAREYFNETDRDALFREAMKSYDTLAALYNPIVIEGAGSISELNLWDKDIVNMRVALHTQAATYLVADIDKGGVFASVYGTIALLPPAERDAIKGIIINKFRGDVSLFDDGRKKLHELTGKPVVGIVPYFTDVFIEQEDSVAVESKGRTYLPGNVNIGVALLKHLSNFTDFDMLQRTPGVNLYYTDRPEELAKADIIVLPGSKNTLSDLRTLHEKGLAQAITAHHRAGKPLYGICGGYQMMGAEMRDPDGVEGDIASLPGLGILPVTTTLAGGKQTRRCSFVFTDGGAEGEGYEIHAGSTPTSRPLCRLNTGEDDGYYLNEATWGTYLHGIFNNASVINRVLRQVNTDVHAEADYRMLKEEGFDRLAQLIRDHVDVSYIYKTLEK